MQRHVEEILAAEREGLLRFCTRLTHENHTAEDLVQETLLIALRQAREGKSVLDWSSWLRGIARMLARSRPLVHESLDETLPGEVSDPLEHLLFSERGELLAQAMRCLTVEQRILLTARYLDETPVQEMASRLALPENTVSARLHRSREALEKLFATELHESASAYGLLSTEAEQGWVKSNLYCPRCGVTRLLGQQTEEHFAMRCPSCDDPGESLAGLGTHIASLPASRVLAGARGFRVGQRRVNQWWESYLHDGLARGRAACTHCGKLASVQPDSGFQVLCGTCRKRFYVAPAGILFHDTAFQEFWRANPRTGFAGSESLVCEGQQAIRVRFASRTTHASIEAVYAKQDLRRLRLSTIVLSIG